MQPPTPSPMPRPVLWVICGAGRGVGKTRLALDLCRVLPDAVYVKQGTSAVREEKPGPLFHADADLDAFLAREVAGGRLHLVVESNALARRGRGDIIIYLETEGGAGGARGPRADAVELRNCAQIRLGSSGSPLVLDEWRDRIRQAGLAPAAEQSVIEVLAAQDRWNRERGLS